MYQNIDALAHDRQWWNIFTFEHRPLRPSALVLTAVRAPRVGYLFHHPTLSRVHNAFLLSMQCVQLCNNTFSYVYPPVFSYLFFRPLTPVFTIVHFHLQTPLTVDSLRPLTSSSTTDHLRERDRLRYSSRLKMCSRA